MPNGAPPGEPGGIGGPRVGGSPYTYEEILLKEDWSDEFKASMIWAEYPERFFLWLRTPVKDDKGDYKGGGMDWWFIVRQIVAPGIFEIPIPGYDSVYVDEMGDQVATETAQAEIEKAQGIEEPTWPIEGIPDTAAPEIPGLYYDPYTKKYYMVDPDTGKGFVVENEDAQRIIDEYWGREEPEPPETGLPPGATPDREWVAPGVYQNPDGTYEDEYGETIPSETAQLMVDDFLGGLTPEDEDALTDPTKVPDIPNTSGYEWVWDGNRWYEGKIEPDEDELKDPQTIPDIPNTPGYEWHWDGNRWVERKSAEEPYEMPPMPTEPPPEGYIWDYNPNTGQWELIPGVLPGTEEPITPAQQAQLDLEERALDLQEQGMAADQAYLQAQLELDYRQQLAQMLGVPASWLQYHAASATQAAIQPWMLPLSAAEYPQLETGEPLPGWGPEWESYYGGQPEWGEYFGWPQVGAPTGMPPQIPPTGVPSGAPQIPPTGMLGPGQAERQAAYNQAIQQYGIPPPAQRPQLPQASQPTPAGPRVPPNVGQGVQETGGLDYSSQMESIISGKYKEILNQFANQYVGGDYMSQAWFDYLNSAEDRGIATQFLSDLVAQAEYQARQWYNETYGEEYPVYPGQQPPTAPPELPPPPITEPPIQPGEPPYPGIPPEVMSSLGELPPELGGAAMPQGTRTMLQPQTTAMAPYQGRTANVPTTWGSLRQPQTTSLMSPVSNVGAINMEQRFPPNPVSSPTSYPQTNLGANMPMAGNIPQLPMLPGELLPGYDPSLLPELMRPGTQFYERMGPTAQAQYGGYERARTGAPLEETRWRQWQMAPPGGMNIGLRYRR